MLKAFAKLILKGAIIDWLRTRALKLPDAEVQSARSRIHNKLAEFVAPEQAALLTDSVMSEVFALHAKVADYAVSQVERI